MDKSRLERIEQLAEQQGEVTILFAIQDGHTYTPEQYEAARQKALAEAEATGKRLVHVDVEGTPNEQASK
jgi:hypothetical protein